MAKSNEVLGNIGLKNNNIVYMDHASATPIDKKVLAVMNKAFEFDYANASSIHDLGVSVKSLLDGGRNVVANILGARFSEVIFTSGATEANNLAFFGILGGLRGCGFYELFKIPHIVVSNIEHASVLEVCNYLIKNKIAEVSFVPVDPDGRIDPKSIRKALKENTVLVSVSYVNNEIGVIFPIREIAKEIRHFRKTKTKLNEFPFFHSDVVQAVNYLKVMPNELGLDLMSFNSAKIYGPKGVGVLYIKRGTPLKSILFGGDQEFGLRPGTENTALILGLVESLKVTIALQKKENKRLLELQKYFALKLRNLFDGLKMDFVFNGDLNLRIPNNLNITIAKIPSDLLVIELSSRGIFVSEKSACASGDKKHSHVIQAIRKANKEPDNYIKETTSIRFSLGRSTRKKDVDFVILSLEKVLLKLKKWYN